jgi:hypothetical protein
MWGGPLGGLPARVASSPIAVEFRQTESCDGGSRGRTRWGVRCYSVNRRLNCTTRGELATPVILP